ncbi:hypothetical protein KAFR_0E04000 [Kazachstania africana CBS 2517]|uniref:Biogenesis of lysosome-related organelles complex 1 subunit CNL1 n=1 Tax=Kazachstania africana (strain ATCC 22294 / BCRC 22015 / CBS 2517 / CECT 1963 / NBRC 1671 / NRRL Y-8276) TaxID=1071382 RepID=H2AW01_KAZAF|nr:hypothetical protein KAFR_0E04000 [Kazachstania africana CBS 2517]CCF58551.1 hypothetical protein KAFR_0E04000 [Kazachstania africana CBS 2517]
MSEDAASENVDPLNINKLSVDYDYLLYKISDHVQSIQLDVKEICEKQYGLINNEIILNVIDENIKNFKILLQKCEDLENYFDMLDQIGVIAESFKERIKQISIEYKKVKKSH